MKENFTVQLKNSYCKGKMIPNEIMEFRFCALETLREIVGRKRLKSIRQKNLK